MEFLKMIKEIKDHAAILSEYLASINRKVTQGQALEALSRLRGSKSWNEMSAKLRKQADARVVKPGVRNGCSAITIFDVSMIDLAGDYEVPEQLAEWEWVEKNSSFRHKENGVAPGVWEHMVFTERGASAEDVPELLKPVFVDAKAAGAVWVLFHQG